MRLRWAAKRQGLRLVRSARRDPLALGYGHYAILDEVAGERIAGWSDTGYHTWTMDDVEAYLYTPPEQRTQEQGEAR